jgi:hypothetical protein
VLTNTDLIALAHSNGLESLGPPHPFVVAVFLVDHLSLVLGGNRRVSGVMSCFVLLVRETLTDCLGDKGIQQSQQDSPCHEKTGAVKDRWRGIETHSIFVL